jgi:hypothetical protein
MEAGVKDTISPESTTFCTVDASMTGFVQVSV